ncbi:MAG TPA: DUF2795 domain-containing protein [Streptosporangiaceae bacterium]|jgi:hypothetical protein
MSEQSGGTHGPAEDDAIKRQDRRDLEAQGEQLPGQEQDEGEQDAAWAAEGRFAGSGSAQEREAIELRSGLARHLDRGTFPATRAHLHQTLSAYKADQRLLDLVSTLPPDATFTSLSELLRALGLPVEQRPA